MPCSLCRFGSFFRILHGAGRNLFRGWIVEWTLAEAFELVLRVAVLKFVAMRLLLSWMPLRIFLTPGIVKAERVRRRAIRYFKVGAERRTSGRTGV